MSESEKPPLLFVKDFGALRPANKAAADAMKAIGDKTTVRLRITRVTANQRRRGFYWVLLAVAAEALQDRTGSPMDAELLHTLLKQKLELGEWIHLPSGDRVFKAASTSDRAMSEPDRARWTDRCANVLSHWLKVEAHVLMDEARSRDGGNNTI